MASRRMKRTKSFSSYINSLNTDINNLKSINDSTSLSAGAITGTSFSEDITLFGSSIKSSDYVGGEAGWKIDSTGVAEFSDVYVRGDINAQTGTIGYWNISSPGVVRRIGSETQFGTFLESENVGPNDDSKTSGIYVGLFKSYFEDPLPISNRRRLSNVATITVLDSGYEAGDRVIVNVAEDASYNNGGLPVTIIAATGDTFSYINTGSNFPAAGALDTTDTASTGTVTFYNPDIAGLYIKDYGKADIDYGYFSSAGLAFVSGSRVNLVHNPSFEFVKSVDITSMASTGGGANVTYLTSTTSGFAVGKNVTVVGAETDGYNVTNAQITLSNVAGFTITSAATGPSSTATGYSKVSTSSSWNYVAATTAAIGLIEFSALTNEYLTASQYGGVISWTNTMSSTYRVEGVVAYDKGLTYNLFSNERVLALSYDSFVDYKPFTAEATAMYKVTGNTSQMGITTTGAHGLSVGDLVYCDFIAEELGADWFFGPGLVTVAGVPSDTQIRIVNPNGTFVPTFTMTPAAIGGRTTSIYKTINPAIPLDQISFKFANGTSTPIANVVNAVTTASWGTANNKYLAQDAESWMVEYLAPVSGIQPLKPVSKAPIYIDAEKLRLAYASLDAANFANAVNVTLSIPAAIYQQIRNVSTYTTSNIAYMTSVVGATAISGNGTTVTVTAPNNFEIGDTVTITGASTAAYNTIINLPVATASSSQFTVLSSATGTTSTATATAYRRIRQLFDSVSLSTEPVAFYGDSSSDYAWEDPSLNTAAQISIQDPKKWVDVDLATQTGYLSNLDFINLKQSRLSEPMLVQPGIEADADFSYDIGNVFSPDYNYETLKLSSGIVSVFDGTNYLSYESRHNLAASKTKSVNQIIASFQNSSDSDSENYANSSSITLESNVNSTSITLSADSISAVTGSTLYVSTIQGLPTSFDPRVSFPSGILADNIQVTGTLTVDGGTTYSGTTSYEILRITSQDGIGTGTQGFQLGATAGLNLQMDRNSVQAYNNGAAAALNINELGGTVSIGVSTSAVIIEDGNLLIENSAAVPSSATTGGGTLFVDAGALKYRGTSGSNATIINADGSNAAPLGFVGAFETTATASTAAILISPSTANTSPGSSTSLIGGATTSTTGTGGALNLTGGAATAGTGITTGGSVNIAGGAGNSTGGIGGTVFINGGTGSGSNGNGAVTIGNGAGTDSINIGKFNGVTTFNTNITITNTTAAPASSPVGGGILYVDTGALKYRGTSGSAATIVNADGTNPAAFGFIGSFQTTAASSSAAISIAPTSVSTTPASDVSIIGGATTNTTGNAGEVYITGGASTTGTGLSSGGGVVIRGGATNTTAGIGGNVTINGGQGSPANGNGSVTIGNATTAGVTIGAPLTLSGLTVAGYVTNDASGNIGTVVTIPQSAITSLVTDLGNKADEANPTFTGTATGLQGVTGSSLGNFTLTTPASVSGTVTRSLSIATGNGFYAGVGTGASGAITIDTGAGSGGTAAGVINIGTTNTPTITIGRVGSTTSLLGTVTGLTKSSVGLGNVDNTSDANKPVSTDQQAALDLKANAASASFTGNMSFTSTASVVIAPAAVATSPGNAISLVGGATTNTTGVGGSLNLTGGASTTGTGLSTGGNVTIRGGATNTTNGAGGNVTINGGQGSPANGNGSVTIGNATTDSVTIGASLTLTSGVSGALNLTGTSSPLQVQGSAGTTGYVLTSAGAGATPTWTPVAGTIQIASNRTTSTTGTTALAINTGETFAITFPVGRFSASPAVTASTSSPRYIAAVTAVTTSGFTLSVRNVSDATGTTYLYHWHAIEVIS